MADFYKQRDVQFLLKHRKILFLGDSNVRPLYKDLICALTRKELISLETLKNPNVESYFGDIAVQQCGRKSEWTFWENRRFEEGPWRVEMFCTGRVLIAEILQYISELPEYPSSIPDVVYVSFVFPHGKNTRSLVSKLLVDLKLKLPCNTLVLVGSSFPTTKDMFGDPRFDEVPFFTMGKLPRDEETEEEIIGKVSSLGFCYLNIAHYLRKNVFRGMTTEHGWESVIVRYTTFLLLTYIANRLLIKTPNRVNQDVLHKAMSSGNNGELELYNNLLMKQASDWMRVKSNSLTGVMDLTASNTYEVTQMLWKVYHRSRSHSSPRRTVGKKQGKKNKSRHRNGRKISGKTSNSPIKPGSSREERDGKGRSRITATTSNESASCSGSTQDLDEPPKTKEEQKNDNEKQQCSQKIISPAGNVKQSSINNYSRMDYSPLSSVSQGYKKTNDDEQGRNTPQKDEESLEEGEIPDSPCGSTKSLIQSDELWSDESGSSEVEINTPNASSGSYERVAHHQFPIAPYHQYHQRHCTPYQWYQNYQSQAPAYSAAIQNIHCIGLHSNEPATAIEVSDEELDQEEDLKDNNADEAIINLNSEEESKDSNSLHKERIEVQQLSPDKKRKERSSKYGRNDKLRLIVTEGFAISWPSDKAKSGQDILWKWWRSHIQYNNGLIVLCHSGIERIYGVIPTLWGEKGTYITVPKIVDDIQQFLTCLEETTFPESCINLNDGVNGSSKNSNEKQAKTVKLLPLAEELSRGSVKRINFEISKKKITCVRARITIKEFASIRNLTARISHKSNLDIPREPEAGCFSNFYSYGEQTSSCSTPSTDKAHWPTLGHWVSYKSDAEKSITSSSKTVVEASEYQEVKRSSRSSDCRRGNKSCSKETGNRRRRKERTSSSSDRSVSRDSSSEHRRRHQNSADHESRDQDWYDWHRAGRVTDRSDGYSHPREGYHYDHRY